MHKHTVGRHFFWKVFQCCRHITLNVLKGFKYNPFNKIFCFMEMQKSYGFEQGKHIGYYYTTIFPSKKKITLPKVCVKMQFVINSKSNCPAK
jgi:hypothetical protein